MRSISSGSSMLAITFTRPPQRTHCSISIPNTRFSRRAQFRGEPGGGFGSRVARGVTIFGIPVGSLPRPERADDEEDLEESLRGVEHVFEATYRLSIRQEGDVTEIQYGNEPTIEYRHGVAIERDGAAARAEWQDGVLTVEHELADGARVSERYSVEPRSGDLRWTGRLKRRKESAIDIERVFFRVRDAAP
jgi:hypothetical protein